MKLGLFLKNQHIQYHTLFFYLGPGIGAERWYRPEFVWQGLRPLEGQSQVRYQK